MRCVFGRIYRWCEPCHESALWSRIPCRLHVSPLTPPPHPRTPANTGCRTPWLTTRRRTCPICKGDVVRSIARASPSSPPYESYHPDNSDEDDVQVQAAQSVNHSSSAALPIPRTEEADLEQGGIASPTPTRPRRPARAGSWRSFLTSSLGSGSGSGSARNPAPQQEDRNR